MSRMKNRDSNRRRREDRQIQAKIRQEAYDKLTIEQRLDKLGNLTATKQRNRLLHALSSNVTVMTQDGSRSVAAEVVEGVEALAKTRKGQKAKRQAKKDKKAN